MKYLKIIISQLYISRDFIKKLAHNFHELTVLEKVIYLIFLRWFIPTEKRFFFEGSLLVPGQMYIGDRKALFDIVVNNKPKHCYEIGTYTGGGSTYFLASAFHKIGVGKVITLESDRDSYDRAVAFYQKRLTHLLPYVEFVYGDSFDSFLPHLEKDGSVDCLFLDGAENEEQTKEQYASFSKYIKSGTILMAHDWNTEKMIALRPSIDGDNKWNKIIELNEPQSVGFAVFERI